MPTDEQASVNTPKANNGTASIDNNVSQNDTIVNNKYVQSRKNNTDKMKMSLVVDSEGNNLTEAQAEFFKDSKVRDSEGNLLKCYHSTNKEFSVFDRKKIGSATDDGIWGTGFYFSNRYNDLYGDKVYEVYLNIRKPFILNEFKIYLN